MHRLRDRHHAREVRLLWGLHLKGRSGRIAFGIVLIALGVVIALEQQDIIARGFWRHGWPWIIVALSVVQIATATTAGRLQDGVFFGLTGVWLVMVESHWHGLTYGNSWPLTLVAVGASYVVQAVAGTFMPEAPRGQVLVEDGSGEAGGGDA